MQSYCLAIEFKIMIFIVVVRSFVHCGDVLLNLQRELETMTTVLLVVCPCKIVFNQALTQREREKST